jgi:hypothetical protein
MDPVAKEVYLTITYQYLKGKPAGFMNLRAIWLDITGCGASDEAPKNDKIFTASMRPWTVTFDGPLLGTAGHLHDGGKDVKVYLNDKVICDSNAIYGGRGYVESASAMGDMASMAHIGKMTTCVNMGEMKKGDTIHIDANYDFTAHPGMKNTAGGLSDIMGISVLYTAIPME